MIIKNLAIIANLAVFVLLTSFFFDSCLGTRDHCASEEYWIYFAFVAYIALNLYVNFKADLIGWAHLVFERKKAEEKKKIADLNTKHQ